MLGHGQAARQRSRSSRRSSSARLPKTVSMKDLIKYGDECFEFDSFGMVKPPETRHWERVLRPSQDDMHTLRLSKPAFFREPDAPVLVDCTQLFRTLKTRVYSTDAAIEVSKKWVASRYWTCRRALKQENSKKITVAECENFMPRDSLHNFTELLQQKMDQDCIAIMRQLTWHAHVQLCDAQHLTLKKEKPTQSGNTSSSCRHREAAARLIEDMSVLTAPSLDQAPLTAPSMPFEEPVSASQCPSAGGVHHASASQRPSCQPVEHTVLEVSQSHGIQEAEREDVEAFPGEAQELALRIKLGHTARSR